LARISIAFGLAFLVTYVLSVSGASTHVVQQFQAMPGAPAIGLIDRLQWLIADLFGMAKLILYPGLIAVALIIAFTTATFIARLLPSWRFVGYVLAGALGMLVLHLAVTEAVGTHAVAASRTTAGLLWQAFAGALGGLAFARFERAGASSATNYDHG